METSTLLNSVYIHLQSTFPNGWIDSMTWVGNGKAKSSLTNGLKIITEARKLMFNHFSRFALAGRQFVDNYDVLNQISDWALVDVVVKGEGKYKVKLEQIYRDFLLDVQDSVNLLRYHINITLELYTCNKQVNMYSVVRRLRSADEQDYYVSLLEEILDVCWHEYRFSFSESYIKSLSLKDNYLKECINHEANEERNTIAATIGKISLLLCKLAVFSKEKKISYNINFQQHTISSNDFYKESKDKFHTPFLQFVDPEQISDSEIYEFQMESWHEDVSMWKLVLLMRYYSKRAKNLIQINKLLEIYEKQYKESVLSEQNAINDYAARSVKNYMYNCRFSYLCQYHEGYSISELKKDLDQIAAVQQETFIYNYHPYQKAYTFVRDKLESAMEDMKPQEVLEELLELLKQCFQKFKDNLEWCRTFQPYIYQLRFNYCTDKWNDVEVFCPSSYCRPLRFKDLDQSVDLYNNQVWSFENRVKQNPDRIKLLNAHEEIKNIEKKNFELLSFFTTLIVFLVGLLSIFIGNASSMRDKMEYVILLGTILLLFVCLGYFIAGKRFDQQKPWIFGGLGIILLCMLGYYYFHSDPPKIPEKPNTSQIEKTRVDSCEIKAR